MYYHDFSASFDWFHHAEGWNAFTLSGSAPHRPGLHRPHGSYARMFCGEDPEAENYDKEHKIIRSLNGNARSPPPPHRPNPTQPRPTSDPTPTVRGRVQAAAAGARDADRLGG